MAKTPKIDAITGVLTFHIPIDPDDSNSVIAAYALADALLATTPKSWQSTLKKRVNRVPAPAPAPVAAEPESGGTPGDGMDFPSGLDRRGEAEQDAAE